MSFTCIPYSLIVSAAAVWCGLPFWTQPRCAFPVK